MGRRVRGAARVDRPDIRPVFASVCRPVGRYGESGGHQSPSALCARAGRTRLEALYITIWPATGIWSEQPLKNVEDLRALSVRTYDNNSAEVMRTVGATAEYLPFNEAIAKVKEHKLNAILTSGDGGAGRKLWDDLRHFTPINYAIPISIAFVRQDDFEDLPKEAQDEVEAAASEMEKSQLELLANRIVENYKRMRSNGVSIDEPAPPAVIVALKKAGSGPIAAWQTKVSAEGAVILVGPISSDSDRLFRANCAACPPSNRRFVP